MGLDKTIFKIINGYNLPSFLDSVFAYMHGLQNVEIIFFLFCIILFLIVIGTPRKGPRAATAVFIATMLTYFGIGFLRNLFTRTYPIVDESLGVILRFDMLKAESAFPVMSNVLFALITTSIIFYFPKLTVSLLVASIFYAVMPVYLGVAYPSDAFGSLLLGYVLGYVSTGFLSRFVYFFR